MGLKDWMAHSWKLFSRDPTLVKGVEVPRTDPSTIYASRPDRVYISPSTQNSILTPLYVKIANDVTQLRIRHCKVDENESFTEEINSYLNDAFKFSPNLDQSPDAFIRDMVLTMLEEGVVAIVPTETDVSPLHTNGFDIKEMRTGIITQWYSNHVAVNMWNPLSGNTETYTMPKKDVVILENPFYASMNAGNSTAQRLARKQQIVDKLDSETADTKKLNLLIQLPYTISNAIQQEKANQRIKSISDQMRSSEFGIAYLDGAEKVVQLNRALDPGIRDEVDYLYKRLLNELGISQSIVDGTADETAVLNYYNSIIEPILSAIVSEFTRKFTTKTGRTQGQRIMYFKDTFKLVPINQMADMVDKFSRNEILTGNEIRGLLGIKPNKQESADELRNKNVAKPVEKGSGQEPEAGDLPKEGPKVQNESTSKLNKGDEKNEEKL